MICKMMTWGLRFCPGIRVTCPGDAKAVAAKAEEKRLGRGLGRVKITNDTLIVFLVEHISKVMIICAEVWPEKGTMNSGQDVFYSFELKPQLLEQPIQFLGVCPIFRNVFTPHSFTFFFRHNQSILHIFHQLAAPIIHIKHIYPLEYPMKSPFFPWWNHGEIQFLRHRLSHDIIELHVRSGPGWGSRRPRKVPPRMPQTAARNRRERVSHGAMRWGMGSHKTWRFHGI